MKLAHIFLQKLIYKTFYSKFLSDMLLMFDCQLESRKTFVVDGLYFELTACKLFYLFY